jgi:hypothetical protein
LPPPPSRLRFASATSGPRLRRSGSAGIPTSEFRAESGPRRA